MASTLVITIKSARTQGDLARYKLDTTAPRNQMVALKQLFENLASGQESASVDVQTSANAPVRASATATLSYADIANNDTITVGGVELTCVTGTPSGAQFKKQTNATVTAANLVTLINANTTTNKLVSAASTAGVVTITALVPGVVGNKILLVTSNATGFVLTGSGALASGAGGSETVAVNYSRGL